MAWFFIGISIIIIVCFVFLTIRYILLKQDLKYMKAQITYMEEYDTNLLLRSVSMDSDMLDIMNSYNNILKKMRHSSIHLLKEEQSIKQVISNVSHDLRTPITSILGYTQLLQKESLDETQLSYVNIISSKSQLMKTLVEQLFNYSLVLEQDNITLESVNVHSLLEDAILHYYDEFNRKHMNLVLKLSEESTYCLGDKLSLKRAFHNIISNALKYGEDTLTIYQDGTIIQFTNKSSLIDSIDTNKLFDRFFTLGSHRGNHSMGLGLTIAKQLVEAMDGSISATKENDHLTIKIELKAV